MTQEYQRFFSHNTASLPTLEAAVDILGMTILILLLL